MTAEALTLDDWAARNLTVLPGLRTGRHLTLTQRYAEWIATPDGVFVHDWIANRALRMVDNGWRHYSLKALWEAARFARDVQVGPNAGWKLNNDFTSHLARQLMDEFPSLAGFFETRRLRS